MKLISGAQTGIDRAALDAARSLGIPTGGWCPLGRLAEDGPIPADYPMQETPSEEYSQRTEWNVRDSDATLVVTRGNPTGGTAYTIEMAEALGKPYLVVDADDANAVEKIREWLAANDFAVLNVAGPRETTSPGIYEPARALLEQALTSSS